MLAFYAYNVSHSRVLLCHQVYFHLIVRHAAVTLAILRKRLHVFEILNRSTTSRMNSEHVHIIFAQALEPKFISMPRRDDVIFYKYPPQHFATTPTPTQYPTPPLMPARPRTLIPIHSLTTWLAPSGPSLACSPPPPSSPRPLLSSHLRRRNALSQIHLLVMHLPSWAPYISSLPHEPSDPSKRHRALGGGGIYVL
jgi:hypothetical protein